MQFLSKISQVGNFSIIDNGLYCFHTDGSIERFQNIVSQWRHIFNVQYFIAKVNDDIFCTWQDYKKIIFLNPITGIVFKEKEIVQFRVLRVVNQSILGLYYTAQEDNTYNFSVGKIDKEFKFKILFDTKAAAPSLFLNEYLLCREGNNFLTCHPLSTGAEKWRIDFDTLLNITESRLYGDIFEHKGRIFFYLSNALSTIESMFCVSVETREVLHRMTGFGGFRVQKEAGILYDMRGYTLQMWHLDSLEMRTVDLSNILQPLEWQSNGTDKFLVKEGKIYFIAQSRKSNIILVELDMDTQEVISETDIGSNQFLVNEIRVHDNRIYLLKDNKELLIYEKINL